MVVNTPTGRRTRGRLRDPGRGDRGDGQALITTVQELGAAVQGIESMRSAPSIRVTSLQEHARALDLYGGVAP
jgi:carbamoyl-phosphate synthase large subunit